MVKENQEINLSDGSISGNILMIFALLLIGSLIGLITMNAMSDIILNQETADEVCQQLTNDSIAIALKEQPGHFGGGKLVCSIPSFDATQNIIVKINNE